MKTWHYISTATVTYLLALLLLTPASSLISFVNLPKQLKLDGVSGSIWSGQVSQLSYKQNQLQNVYWSLSPLALLTGNASANLQADIFNNTVTTDISSSFSGDHIQLNNLVANLKATDLQKQLNLPFGELNGELKASAEEIVLLPKQLPVVTGLLSWKNAQLTLAETVSFGDLFLRIAPDDNGGLKGEINNLKGQLSVKGHLTVTAKQLYTVNIRLKPRANAPDELLSMLRLIAPKKDKGEHIVNRSGHLRQLGIKL